MLELLFTVQMTGYLPPPPPRNPITDPMFAASPVRELRRQWDDCIHSMKTLAFMNGITDADRAAGLVDLCAEGEDILTGALVKKIGFKRATAAMVKARKAAQASLRETAGETEKFLKSNAVPAPKIDAALPPTITRVPGGCAGESVTGSGNDARSVGYIYAAKNNADPTHMVAFSFIAPNFTQTLSAKPRPLSFEVASEERGKPSKLHPQIYGMVYRENDQTVVVTEYKGLMVDLLSQWRPESVTLKGPWGMSPHFNLEHAGKLYFEVEQCRVQQAF